MQTHLNQPAAISVTADLIKELDIVVNLAEGNCLDPTDPDINPDDLLEDSREACLLLERDDVSDSHENLFGLEVLNERSAA